MLPSAPSPTIERSYNVSIDQLVEDEFWRRQAEYEIVDEEFDDYEYDDDYAEIDSELGDDDEEDFV